MFLAGMVYQSDGRVMSTLHFADEAKQLRDICCAVFIQTVQANQGIQQQEPWVQVGQSPIQSLLIGVKVQT